MKKIKAFKMKNFKIGKKIKMTAFLTVYITIFSFCSGFLSVNMTEIMYGTALCQVESEEKAPISTDVPHVIAIDPGHGGTDTGAMSYIDEIDLCNNTAQFLFDILENDENFSAVMTRSFKEDPSNDERTKTAKENGAQLLISIHGNCDRESHKSHGFECFPTPPGRIFYEQSVKFARCIAAEMKNEGHRLRGDCDGIRFAYYNGGSKRIVESSDTKVRSQKSFGILEKAPCPAVLVEQGFITNYSDVENWGTEQGCKRAAQVYYRAICGYFSLEPKTQTAAG